MINHRSNGWEGETALDESMRVLDKVWRLCPCCTGAHFVKIVTFQKTEDYRGVTLDYNAFGYLCDAFGVIYADDEQMALNKNAREVAYQQVRTAKKGEEQWQDQVNLRKKFRKSLTGNAGKGIPADWLTER